MLNRRSNSKDHRIVNQLINQAQTKLTLKDYPFPNNVNSICRILTLFFLISIIVSCSTKENKHGYTLDVYQTAQKGDNLKLVEQSSETNLQEPSKQIKIQLHPEKSFQQYIGFGASFTESSAWNLATIPVDKRKEVLTKLFSPTLGAGFTLTRTHINSCDYSNGHYTYVDDGDVGLTSFSICEDKKGFTGTENNQVQNIKLEDPSYDLIPMIQEASSIPGADFKIISSAWSPPSWMKEGETDFMTNGYLSKKYYGTWASYLSKYISAYKKEGIDIWGITPQNEPLHAHDARWDSNGFTPEQGREFLRDHLGPQLVADGHLDLEHLEESLRVLIYDHNKSEMNAYVNPTFEDPEASKHAWGTAFHWYASSKLKENNWYADELKELNTRWPEKGMIHTESSIDIEADDPIGQYWRESLDYAGKFVPFDTYAYDIITNLNNGTQGYIEWCIILSNEGKPNPYDNFNSAPVLINPHTDQVTYTPLYYLLSHFSKFIRPGAKRIGIEGKSEEGLIYTAAQNIDNSIVLVMYNSNPMPYDVNLSLDSKTYTSEIGPRTMQTIQLRKNK